MKRVCVQLQVGLNKKHKKNKQKSSIRKKAGLPRGCVARLGRKSKNHCVFTDNLHRFVLFYFELRRRLGKNQLNLNMQSVPCQAWCRVAIDHFCHQTTMKRALHFAAGISTTRDCCRWWSLATAHGPALTDLWHSFRDHKRTSHGISVLRRRWMTIW